MAAIEVGEPLRFADAARWEDWLERHHDSGTSAWLLIAKKASGEVTVTAPEALDVALCFGWIDGQRKAYDAACFLQRYSRRRPRSTWSQVNVEKVAALTAAGRMRPTGLAEVAAAQADGRWSAAYERQSSATVPPDLVAALSREPRAEQAFAALSRTDRYLTFLPLLKARTPDARAAGVERIVARLAGRP